MRIEHRYGKKIREQRELRGWTQEQLAELAGKDARTVQRAERDVTQSLDTLQAIASAFDTDIAALRSTFRILESRVFKTELLTSPKEFVMSEERNGGDMFTRTVLLSDNDPAVTTATDLWDEVFADRELIEPNEIDLWRSYVQSIREPLQELFDSGHAIYVLNERRESVLARHVGLEPKPDHITLHVRHYLLVPRHGCFQLLGRSGLHRFNPECNDAGAAIYSFANGNETGVYVFPNALQAILTLGGEDKIGWCDGCFPQLEDGLRVDFDYIEKVTGFSRAKLHEFIMQVTGDDSLQGLS
jgi:transcriptional regulator with XRE-family HTH domain